MVLPGWLRYRGLSGIQSGFHDLLQVCIFHGGYEDFQHDAVFVYDDGVGIGAAAAQHGVVGAVQTGGVCRVVLGKNDAAVGVMLCDVGRCGFAAEAAVDRNDGDILGIVGCYLIKIGQLLDAGGAPGAPEIDDGDLTGVNGVDSFLGITLGSYDLQVVTEAQFAYRIAVFFVRCCSGCIRGFMPEESNGTDQNSGHQDGGNDTDHGA